MYNSKLNKNRKTGDILDKCVKGTDALKSGITEINHRASTEYNIGISKKSPNSLSNSGHEK